MDIKSLTIPLNLFNCALCPYLVDRPYQCHECGSLFCYSCIYYNKSEKHACPNKCDPRHLRTLSKAYLRILDLSLIECRMQGCSFVCPVSSMKKHEQSCIYRIKDCFAVNEADRIRQERDTYWMNAMANQYFERFLSLASPQSALSTPRTQNRFNF